MLLPYEPIGESPAFLDFQERLARVAAIDRPVLLLGERGTGKEMAARKIHYLSRRWGQPFVTLHCAALSPSLIESELFGHEEGAFTGARVRRKGRFESADKGSLFLDEVSLIPLETQEKILRVVEYGSFERVGGSLPVETNVRIIGASNANLLARAEEGRFKRDLLDRLSFEVVFLPPLRERGEDIALLAGHFVLRMAREMNLPEIPAFSGGALRRLRAYPWPGNVRELKNVVERAVCRADGALIDEVDFEPFRAPWGDGFEPSATAPATASTTVSPRPGDLSAGSPPLPVMKALPAPVDPADCLAPLLEDNQVIDYQAVRRRLDAAAVEAALRAARHNQRDAARRLGMTYHQFRALLRKNQADQGASPAVEKMKTR